MSSPSNRLRRRLDVLALHISDDNLDSYSSLCYSKFFDKFICPGATGYSEESSCVAIIKSSNAPDPESSSYPYYWSK